MDRALSLRLAPLLLVLCSPLCLRADTITQLRSVEPTPTDWGRTITFDPFPPAGTLTAVTLDIAIHKRTDFGMTFTAPATITLVAGPTLVSVGNLFTWIVPPEIVTASGVNQTLTFPPGVADRVESSSLPLVADALTLPVTATGFSSFHSDSGNGSGSVLTRVGVDLRLTYQYDAPPPPPASVPEPSGIALACSGLAACAFPWIRARFRPRVREVLS